MNAVEPDTGQSPAHLGSPDPVRIRSQLGRADPALVDKAARLAGVTPAQFWSGPEHQATPASPRNTARFPDGIQMTGQPFADLEQWARLTSKLAAGATARHGKAPAEPSRLLHPFAGALRALHVDLPHLRR